MPQLAKGGKHVFGWSQVSREGRIKIPPEAFAEYKLTGCDKAILMPASKSSGGFCLGTVEELSASKIGSFLTEHPELASASIPEGQPVRYGNRNFCWVNLASDGSFSVPPDTLRAYGIEPGHKVLVVRGSGLAVSFLVRGPIIEEAKKHPELEVFQDTNNS